jgi:tRNA U34 5-methylaminomethyl-2-thiouridine-forming methyltransferase MnmC
MPDNQFFITDDGSHTLLSSEHGVSYHSKHGAITETYHVFIDAALRFKAAVQKDIRILEIGFGTGLNAYITLLEAIKRNLNIDYTAVEAYPITLEDAVQLNYKDQIDSEYSALFIELHKASWDKESAIHDQFYLRKALKKIETITAENTYDIIYFDAFAPNAQPELWNKDIMQRMYNALKPTGLLTTYCAKGVVKRTMKAVGFTVERLPGPPGKREMTRALK